MLSNARSRRWQAAKWFLAITTLGAMHGAHRVFAHREDDDAEPHGLTVEARTDKSEYGLLEPIIVRFSVSNEGKKDVYLNPRGRALGEFDLLVTRTPETGHAFSVPRTAYYHSLSQLLLPVLNGGPGRRAEPGSKVKGTLATNLRYDMSEPGTYTIVVDVPYSDKPPTFITFVPATPGKPDDLKSVRSKPIVIRISDDSGKFETTIR